jgi:hypothetical protein
MIQIRSRSKISAALLSAITALSFSLTTRAATPQVIYVAPGSTLIEAARRLAPYVEPEQLKLWAVALYKLNPDAFIDGDIHRVRADFPLLVPNQKQRAEIDADQATLALRVPQRMRLSRRLGSLSGVVKKDGRAESSDGDHKKPPRMSPFAKRASYQSESFKSDPVYPERQYSAEKQLEVYGGKREMKTPRPLVESGYPLYKEGPLGSLHTWFGEKNLASPQFLVYGDSRLVLAGNQQGQLSNAALIPQLNLDTDLKLTGTERIHALFRPLQKDGQFTRIELDRDDNQDRNSIDAEFDLAPATFFIEGDIAAIVAGQTNEWQSWDMPFAIGLMPLFIQNGLWFDDTVLGAAVSIAAKNFPEWGVANADFSAYIALDDVNAQGISGASKPKLAALAFFGDMWDGYVEADWAYLLDQSGKSADQSYHATALAYSWRQNDFSSNSVRLFNSFGQDSNAAGDANGWLVLFESSLITSTPYTVVPYLNLFVGHGTPQAAARKAGILKNTGLAFEQEELAGSKSLTANGHNSAGGAIGIEFLFNLDQQLIFEAAAQTVTRNRLNGAAPAGDEYAVAMRWQKPISSRWIVKADAIKGWKKKGDEFASARLELRVKF